MIMETCLEGPLSLEKNYDKTVNKDNLAEMYCLSEPPTKVCLKIIV